MSLHFLFGRAGTGKTTRCCQDICRYISEDPDAHAILLVPDQATYRAETKLAETFPAGGFTRVDVCGFSRLGYRLRQELREEQDDALSPLVQQIILRRLLRQHKKELRMLGKAASQPHFAKTLTAFFHQLDAFGVTDEALAAAQVSSEDTPLGRKLSDLSLLRREYRAYLTAHFDYRGNLYDKLTADIPRSPMIRGAKIWIDGFNGMIPQEISAVSALIRTARDVTVTLAMDPPREAADYPLFDRPYRLWKALAAEAGSYSSETLTEPHRFTCPRIRELAEQFFRPLAAPCIYPAATRVLPEQGVFVTEAPSRETEVDETVRRIALLVREKGFRYRDILVLLRNADAYMHLLERKLADAAIPAFLDAKRPMTTHPLVRLVSSLLHFLTESDGGRRWKNATLFALLKNPLLPVLADDDVDRLENYVRRVGVKPYQWKREWTFRSYFRLEADEPMSRREAEELAAMNALREALLSRLSKLETAWAETKTARDKTALLYRFLTEESIPQRLAEWDDISYQETKTRPHREVWKKMLALGDDLVKACGDDAMDDAEYLSVSEDGLASLSFALIPPTLDHVTVTTIDRGYAMEGRAVFILGANEGEFPARITEEGILSEADKETLRETDALLLAPDLASLIDQEEFYTYLSLTRARQVLSMSYATADTDGSELSPSTLVLRLLRLGYTTAKKTARLLSPDTTETDCLLRPAQSLALLPGVLREGTPKAESIWAALRDWAHEYDEKSLRAAAAGLSYTNAAKPLPPALAKRLFLGKSTFRTSVSRMENYRGCPYRYFLQYGLKLSEEKEAAVEAPDVGNYLHAGLHQFGEYLKRSQKAWRDATDEEISKTSQDIADILAPRVRSGALLSDAAARYTKNAMDRTLRTTLTRLRAQSRKSEAETVAMEKQFLCPVRAGNETIHVTGSIDRMDVAGGAAVVCDYKTGAPDIDLSQITAGLKLQLITYLMAAVEESGNALLPGALLYLYVQGSARTVPVPADGTTPKEEKTASGYFLADPDFLRALDNAVGTPEATLPIKMTKGNGFYANAPVLSEEEMRALFAKTKALYAALYADLKNGKIPLCPTRYNKQTTQCRFCIYKSICRFDPTLPGNRYEDIPKRSDKEIKEELRIE